ncbi:MAG TPA: DUF6108 family protein [Bacteroidales bacterium]
MMKQLFKRWSTLVIMLLIPLCGWAQKDLKIMALFDEYGKKKGSTMVTLSKEMLEAYDMTLYKSITISENEGAIPKAQKYITEDKKKAKNIKEVINKGLVVSGYYQLIAKTDKGMNRFILFKVSRKGSVSLVYIEGKLDSEDLVTLLFMFKTE